MGGCVEGVFGGVACRKVKLLVVGFSFFVSAKRRPNSGYRRRGDCDLSAAACDALDRESGGPSKLRINKSAALHIRWRSTLRHYKGKRTRSFGAERAKRVHARGATGWEIARG